VRNALIDLQPAVKASWNCIVADCYWLE